MVLIPGFDFGAWSFHWQRPVLSQHLRVITYSPRGVDGSSDVPAGFAVADMAEDLRALLDHLGVERAAVLGYSMGGFIAQEFALAHPERAVCMVVVATSMGGADAAQPDASVIDTMATAASQASTGDEPRADDALYLSEQCLASQPELAAEYRRLRSAHARPSSNWMQRMAMAMAFDASARLWELRAPVLIVTGDDDPIVPPKNAEQLHERLPSAQIERYRGGRHLVNIEFTEPFNARVLEFVRAHQ